MISGFDALFLYLYVRFCVRSLSSKNVECNTSI